MLINGSDFRCIEPVQAERRSLAQRNRTNEIDKK
jgi:hypothetical protein